MKTSFINKVTFHLNGMEETYETNNSSVAPMPRLENITDWYQVAGYLCKVFKQMEKPKVTTPIGVTVDFGAERRKVTRIESHMDDMEGLVKYTSHYMNNVLAIIESETVGTLSRLINESRIARLDNHMVSPFIMAVYIYTLYSTSKKEVPW